MSVFNKKTLGITKAASGVEFTSDSYATLESGDSATPGYTTIGVMSSNPFTTPVSVTITPTNGTAKGGLDYENKPIIVTFNPGQTLKNLSFRIYQDLLLEPTETVNLTLSNLTGGAVFGEDTQAILEIEDDEEPATGAIAFSSTSFSVQENGIGIQPVRLIRTGGDDGLLTVTVTPTNGTAIAPGDYKNTPIVVTFAAGEDSKVVNIPIVDDLVIEPNETLNLTLSNVTNGGTLGIQKTSVLTIVDNDAKPGTFAFNKASYTVKEDGTTVSAITITRSGGSKGFTSVTVVPSDGTAIAPGDYSKTPIVVPFLDGQTIKTVTVPIVNDILVEPNETLNLALINPTGGTSIGVQKTATLTIQNDDRGISGLVWEDVNGNGVKDNTSSAKPLDLAFSLDLSASFADDLPKLKAVVPSLITAIKGIQPDSLFGVTSFIDKPIAPFGSAGEYPYKTDSPLTTNTTLIQNTINGLFTRNGADAPESQIEALLQIARRTSELGFRATTRRVVFLATDAAFHQAGNGAAAGITKANNGDGILDGTPAGTGEDYPAVAQVKSALLSANIIPIFAVTLDQKTVYDQLVANLGVGVVVPLTTDSSNFVSAVTRGVTEVSSESGLAGVKVYLDLNKNGVLDATEPTQTTATDNPATLDINETGSYSFNNIPVGSYIVRQVMPTGYQQTYPFKTTGFYSHRVTVNESDLVKDINFGIQRKPVPGVLSFKSTAYSVKENGTSTTPITIIRTGGKDGAVTVKLTPSNGTATAPSDYTNTTITVSFANGQTTKTVTIPVVNDTVSESTQTLNLTLSTPSGGATLGTPKIATLTIQDDDIAPTTKKVNSLIQDPLIGATTTESLVGSKDVLSAKSVTAKTDNTVDFTSTLDEIRLASSGYSSQSSPGLLDANQILLGNDRPQTFLESPNSNLN